MKTILVISALCTNWYYKDLYWEQIDTTRTCIGHKLMQEPVFGTNWYSMTCIGHKLILQRPVLGTNWYYNDLYWAQIDTTRTCIGPKLILQRPVLGTNWYYNDLYLAQIDTTTTCITHWYYKDMYWAQIVAFGIHSKNEIFIFIHSKSTGHQYSSDQHVLFSSCVLYLHL